MVVCVRGFSGFKVQRFSGFRGSLGSVGSWFFGFSESSKSRFSVVQRISESCGFSGFRYSGFMGSDKGFSEFRELLWVHVLSIYVFSQGVLRVQGHHIMSLVQTSDYLALGQ